MNLDDYLQVWPGHGAGSACGKVLGAVPDSTVGYEKRFNPSIRVAGEGENAFVEHILEDQPEPPVYFGRMKRQNRDGVPRLGRLPRPRRLGTRELSSLAGRLEVAIVDTRTDRSAFMRAHLPASLYAPLDKSLSTIVGCYVTPEVPVYLIVEERDVEEAVRALVRVGIDRVEGYATPDVLKRVEGLVSIEEIGTAQLEARRTDPDMAVIDVRRRDEFRMGHVPGALPAPHTRLMEIKDDLPADRTLLVYCQTGNRAASGSAFLARYGFDVVYVNGLFSDLGY